MSDETGSSSWTYDSLNRLKSAVKPYGQTLTYNYDLANRITSMAYPPALVPGAPGSTPSTVATGTVTRTFDDDDRMRSPRRLASPHDLQRQRGQIETCDRHLDICSGNDIACQYKGSGHGPEIVQSGEISS